MFLSQGIMRVFVGVLYFFEMRGKENLSLRTHKTHSKVFMCRAIIIIIIISLTLNVYIKGKHAKTYIAARAPINHSNCAKDFRFQLRFPINYYQSSKKPLQIVLHIHLDALPLSLCKYILLAMIIDYSHLLLNLCNIRAQHLAFCLFKYFMHWEKVKIYVKTYIDFHRFFIWRQYFHQNV